MSDVVPPTIELTLILNHDRAWALAQLCKRIGWTELRGNSADANEAYVMRDAITDLQAALANAGVNPR